MKSLSSVAQIIQLEVFSTVSTVKSKQGLSSTVRSAVNFGTGKLMDWTHSIFFPLNEIGCCQPPGLLHPYHQPHHRKNQHGKL